MYHTYMQTIKQELRKDTQYRSETPIVQPPHLIGSKCMDTDFSTNSGINGNNDNLSWRSTKIPQTQTPINILCLPPVHTTSQHFHLPPHYETHDLTINISLNISNLNMINISSPKFRKWQHQEDHWNRTKWHHLVNIHSVPINQLYKHMISGNSAIPPFMSTDESMDDTASTWTLFSHTCLYVMVIGWLIPVELGIFCCYFFWWQPVKLVSQPLWSGSIQHTIVDDDVEKTPIYRCNSKVGQSIIRPHKKQKTQSKVIPAPRSLDTNSKIQGTW